MKSSTSSDLKKYWPSGFALRVASRANRMLDPGEEEEHGSRLFDFTKEDECIDLFIT